MRFKDCLAAIFHKFCKGLLHAVCPLQRLYFALSDADDGKCPRNFDGDGAHQLKGAINRDVTHTERGNIELDLTEPIRQKGENIRTGCAFPRLLRRLQHPHAKGDGIRLRINDMDAKPGIWMLLKKERAGEACGLIGGHKRAARRDGNYVRIAMPVRLFIAVEINGGGNLHSCDFLVLRHHVVKF